MKMKSVAEIAEGLHKGREKMMEKLNLPDKFAQGTATAMIQKYDTMLDNLALEQDMIRESKEGISGKTPMQMGKYGGMFKKYQLGGGLNALPFWGNTSGNLVGDAVSGVHPSFSIANMARKMPWDRFFGNQGNNLNPESGSSNQSNPGSMNDFESIRNWTNETFGQPPFIPRGQDMTYSVDPTGNFPIKIGSSYKGGKLNQPFSGTTSPTYPEMQKNLVTGQNIGDSGIGGFSGPEEYPQEIATRSANPISGGTKNPIDTATEKTIPGTPQAKTGQGFDIASGIAGSVLPLVDNIVNYALTRKAAKDPLPTPTYRKYAAMNPTVDVEAQRKDVNESQQSMNRSIDRSVSGPAALAAKMAARSQSVGALNSIEQEKRMQERATQNQNRQGYQDVANANAGLLDNYRNMQYAKRQEIRGTDSENVTNAVADLLQMRQDDVARELDMDKMTMIMQAYDKRIISRNVFDLLSPEMQKRLTELGIKVEG